MEGMVFNEFLKSVGVYLSYVNWLFIVAFMFWSWLIEYMIKGATALKRIKSISKKYRVISVGLIVAVIFAILFKYKEAAEYQKLFFAIPVGMFIWSVAFKKIFGSNGENRESNN